MATDYDAPRDGAEDPNKATTEVLGGATAKTATTSIDVDEAEESEKVLPGADLSDAKLEIRVVPTQVDEFVCQCNLVHHVSQCLDQETRLCVDCKGWQ